MAKNELAFHSDQHENQVFTGLCAQQVGGNMLMFHIDVKQGLVLKMTSFNDSESTLSFESSQVTFIYIALLTIQIVTKHCIQIVTKH